MFASHVTAAMLPAAVGPPERSARTQALGLIAVTTAGFFMAADVTITNVALPTIARELDSSISTLQWVIDSYNIAAAGLVLLGAGLGERYSRKWTFLGGVALFLIGSLGAGLSSSVGQLITARTVMGIGGAIIVAPALSMISVLFPPERRARAVASWSAAGALGLAVSPIAGGVLLTIASWNWVFLVNVPFMGATLLLGAFVLPNSRSPDPHRLDFLGAVLSVLGLGLLLGGIIEAPAHGWTNPVIVAAITAGIVTIAGFVFWELHTRYPMFEVRILRRRGVLGAAISLFAAFLAFTGIIFLVAQQLQVVNGVTPIQLGFSLLPFAIVLWLVSRQSTGAARRLGPARTLNAGSALLIAAFVVMAATSPLDSPALIITGTLLCAAGCGLMFPIGSVVILNDLPDQLTGSASGTSMLSRLAGASVGVAVLGTVLAGSLPQGNAHTNVSAFSDGVTAAYLAGVVLVVALALAQLLVLRRWAGRKGPPATAPAPRK